MRKKYIPGVSEDTSSTCAVPPGRDDNRTCPKMFKTSMASSAWAELRVKKSAAGFGYTRKALPSSS